MSDWTERPLGELATMRRGIGYTEATLRSRSDDGVPYLNMKSFVKEGGYNRDGLKFFAGSYSAPDVALATDVLIANTDVTPSGDIIGVPALLPKNLRSTGALFSHHVTRIRPTTELAPEFLHFALCNQSSRRSMLRIARGTTVLMLDASALRRVPITFPTSIVEQRRIAAILTSLDTAIEATEALIEKHQQIKAGLIHDLFARGVALDGSIRAPRVRSRADGAELDALPAGWDVLPLQRCLTESASNGIYKPPHLIGSGALLVGQTAITEDRSVDPKLARRAVVSAAEVRRFGVAAGDVLVARVFATVEGVGRPALVPDLGEPAVFESNMMRLRVAASVVRPRLLFEWLKSDASRRHIEGRANASNQVSVNQSVLYPLPVPIPPMEEQDRMVERIEAADRARAADLAVLEKLRMQKQGLMQDLLTGKVRVPVPADASA